MSPDLANKLVVKFPELFANAGIGPVAGLSAKLEIEDGWFSLVDVLCEQLMAPVRGLDLQMQEIARSLQTARTDVERSQLGAHLELTKLQLEEQTRHIPRVLQIKEKGGSMRFYVSHANDRQRGMISIVEALSERMCELCGAPGKLLIGGWLKTRCQSHIDN